ncbi:Gypsy retrotransposon integrase-like protein 1 [Elysia marginata]|uniref:Gypsy retrotransposon integrase-like protein 1 n=1 Tax=Elysia marginata TaxID=1093978 RepID=A0AAV4IWR4_9GAST|nr:Gypsy retrotransposon integrase-like protein 1 [Elysia marginata]
MGKVRACLLEDPTADVILGNIKGIREEPVLHSTPVVSDSHTDKSDCEALVVTRAQSKNLESTTSTPSDCDSNITDSDVLSSFTDIGERQKNDPSLAPWFKRVGSNPVSGVSFILEDGILKRKYSKSKLSGIHSTLVVPESLRDLVLSYAYDSVLAGHFGFRKTLVSIKSQFSWPNLYSDVKKYVRSCHVCQIKPRTSHDKPAPLQRVYVAEEPFQRVTIDIIGPLPVSEDRFEYFLTMVDVATRWAEAVPLRRITATDVAESLFQIICRLGFPLEIV